MSVVVCAHPDGRSHICTHFDEPFIELVHYVPWGLEHSVCGARYGKAEMYVDRTKKPTCPMCLNAILEGVIFASAQ